MLSDHKGAQVMILAAAHNIHHYGVPCVITMLYINYHVMYITPTIWMCTMLTEVTDPIYQSVF